MTPLKKQTHLLTDEQQAIVALCTPRGSGAIGLIRISGSNAVDVVDRIARLSSGKKLADLSTHTIHHGHVIASSQIIDSVLFLLMHGPRTFTGQDTVEITCHNNPFIIEKIIDLAIQAGARQARAGEFTRRAFLNDKVDLIQAESINDVIHAQSELALQKSMTQLEGSLSQVFTKIYHGLFNLLAHVEASFEFLDEEQRDFDFDSLFAKQLDTLLVQIQSIKKDFSLQQQIKQGIRIAILGSVNAGKSTLFNALLNKERAIVSDIQGTTRDSIESTIYRDGAFWMMIDTAGIRQTGDVIEQKGIERSYDEAKQADIILLVIDGSCKLTQQQREQYQSLATNYKNKIILIINKADALLEENGKKDQFLAGFDRVFVSSKNRLGIQVLENSIEQKKNNLFSLLESPFLLNERQYKVLTEIEQSLKNIANNHSVCVQYELVAYQIKDLLDKVSELTGRNVTEQLLDTVFDQFCVGK